MSRFALSKTARLGRRHPLPQPRKPSTPLVDVVADEAVVPWRMPPRILRRFVENHEEAALGMFDLLGRVDERGVDHLQAATYRSGLVGYRMDLEVLTCY